MDFETITHCFIPNHLQLRMPFFWIDLSPSPFGICVHFWLICCFSSQISLSWLEFWRALVELCSVSINYHIVSGPFFSFYSFYLREQYFRGEFQLIASVINREPDSIACLLTWFVFSTEISAQFGLPRHENLSLCENGISDCKWSIPSSMHTFRILSVL